MQKVINGNATTTPAHKKEIKALSYMTLINSKGIHPTGEVFLIMKDIVMSAVILVKLLSKFVFTFK